MLFRSDFTQVIVELTDDYGTVLPYDRSEVAISVSDVGTLIGQEKMKLEGGHIGFMVQSKYNRTGIIIGKVWLADDSAVMPATFEIEVKALED